MTPSVTFRDPSLEEEYRQQGFVVMPFLDEHEVAMVREGYQALVPPGDHGLTIDYMRPDRSAMYAIADLLEPVWARHFPEVFDDHRPVFTTFVTKHPGPASDMFLHEDRTFVDERRFRAGTLWVPLVDVGPTLDNGGLEVIPASHLLTDSWSGTATPELFRPYEPYLRERLEPIAVPAGHALYYDTRTLHASPANRSDSAREAVVCAVAPRRAELIHVVATSRRHRRVHRVDESFFLEVHPHAVDDSVGARFPVIDEFEDDTRLGPVELVAHLGPARSPLTRPDRRPDAPPGVTVADRRLPVVHDDLPRLAGPANDGASEGTTDEATTEPTTEPTVPVERIHGTIGVRRLDAARHDELPWVDALRPLAAGMAVAAVITIEPGSQVLLPLDRDDTDHQGNRATTTATTVTRPGASTIDIIDVAPAAGTIEVGGDSMPLNEDLRLELEGGVGPVLISHDGPGALSVLVMQAARARPDIVADLAAGPGPGIGTRARRLAHRVRASLTS